MSIKYLSDYANAGISKALDQYGAFFAFSSDQFNAQKKPNTIYASLPGGMVCPADNVSALMSGLDANYHAAIKQDIEENGLTAIVLRELNNYECFYTGDIEDAVDALADYPVDYNMILATYRATAASYV